METDEVRDRPLDPFGTDTPMQLCALWKPSAPFFLIFPPPSKKATSFPLKPSAERGRPFIPFYFPDGCISVNVW